MSDMREYRHVGSRGGLLEEEWLDMRRPQVSPGKVSLTSRLQGPAPGARAAAAPTDGAAVQRKALSEADAARREEMTHWEDAALLGIGNASAVQAERDTLVHTGQGGAVQMRAAEAQESPEVPVRLPGGGGGAEMPEDVRAKIEGAFGADFSSVRIHEGPHAQAVGAFAYTQGTDIHFAPGQYQPQSQRGQELLGHELTHVVQQSQGRVRAAAQAKGVDINDDPALEREADEMGARAARVDELAMAEELDEYSETYEYADEAEEVMDGDSPPGLLVDVPGEDELEGNEAFEEIEAVEPEIPVSAPLAATIMRKPRKAPSTSKATTNKAKPHIKSIEVDLSKQRLTISWSDGKTSKPIVISSGKGLPDTKDDPCKDPNVNGSQCTPIGHFAVGKKGDRNYKNQKGDAMAYYVEFEAKRAIGIHDSQPVTGKPASHGCVRVDMATSKLINENVTKSTKVNVSGKAPTKPYKSKKKRSKPRRPSKSRKKRSKPRRPRSR
jgi:lipoprotein-anchoring transpeptidase ErfK/SrfK